MELDRILIKDLSVSGIIGINPDERINEQEILVSATLWADTRPAAASDDIADAANYRTITKALIAHIEQGKPMLVERLVQEGADVITFTSGSTVESFFALGIPWKLSTTTVWADSSWGTVPPDWPWAEALPRKS